MRPQGDPVSGHSCMRSVKAADDRLSGRRSVAKAYSDSELDESSGAELLGSDDRQRVSLRRQLSWAAENAPDEDDVFMVVHPDSIL